MKIKFKHQQYQADATQSVVDIFEGQQKNQRKNVIGRDGTVEYSIFSNAPLSLPQNILLKNLQNIQKKNEIKHSENLENPLNFSIEMETGTGKTYVYIKTMFELHKKYGWNKFIIMVPSIAIREGVQKSLEITAEHFHETYGEKIRFFTYNTKNKSNLVNLKNFANTSNIEVIIMNYQAFNIKEPDGKISGGEPARKIYQKLDSLQSERPIDIIKRANPILIIDEPQRFGDKAEKKLSEFNPLFHLRYSATHKKEYNKVYQLDAIDAYNQKLVKKISVKGVEVIGNEGTNSYIYLDTIHVSTKSYPTALIEFEKKQKQGLKKIQKKVSEGDDLFVLSGELKEYRGFVVKEINAKTSQVLFTNGISIYLGQAIGDVDEKHIRRIQIRETILSHFQKEQELFHKGIKVLSLFFIDEVAKYRRYDEKGNYLQGEAEYEKIFEEEYINIFQQKSLFSPEYNKYLEKFSAQEVHNGYFSKDKKGKFIDSKESRGKENIGSNDTDAYDLIMKNKEQLLSFSEPTRFIFSHSALREGWDNPNIFQICTLKHSQSENNKRQEIGRGLRLSVNESGERMDFEKLETESEFFEVNTLTVVASESYKSFSDALQKEMMNSLSDRPIKLTVAILKTQVFENEKGETLTMNDEKAMNLIFDLKGKNLIDSEYKITDTLKKEIEEKNFTLPDEFIDFVPEISQFIEKIYNTDNFSGTENGKKNDIDERNIKPNSNFQKKEFQDLWNQIKVKTSYQVDFDTNELVQNAIIEIDKNIQVKTVKVTVTQGDQLNTFKKEQLATKDSMQMRGSETRKAKSIIGATRYDIVGEISKSADVSRKTTVQILKGINKNSFLQLSENPEHFIIEISRFIAEQKATTLINKIIYSKTNNVYDDEIFTINRLNGSSQENILKVQKHIYDYVKTDSKIETLFAQELETGSDISVYAKLPNGFKIPTPVGNYNPDWAIVIDSKEIKHIFFIAETKGSMSTLQLKKSEAMKIEYAKKHFDILSKGNIKYGVITGYSDLQDKILK